MRQGRVAGLVMALPCGATLLRAAAAATEAHALSACDVQSVPGSPP